MGTSHWRLRSFLLEAFSKYPMSQLYGTGPSAAISNDGDRIDGDDGESVSDSEMLLCLERRWLHILVCVRALARVCVCLCLREGVSE